MDYYGMRDAILHPDTRTLYNPLSSSEGKPFNVRTTTTAATSHQHLDGPKNTAPIRLPDSNRRTARPLRNNLPICRPLRDHTTSTTSLDTLQLEYTIKVQISFQTPRVFIQNRPERLVAMGKCPEELRATDSLDLGHGLSIVPRLRLILSFARSDLSVKPIDEWQIKVSLSSFLKDCMSITLSEGDLVVKKFRDLKKRKRIEPVASGVLYLWDLSSVRRESREETKSVDERFADWKDSVVRKLDGMELNLEGLKLRLNAYVPETDEFQKMIKAWEESFGARNRGYISRNVGQQPYTLILEGVPSRWFSEPRVSSRVSVLVTHTIFSKFGKIRNLDVVGGNDLDNAVQEAGKGIAFALQCKVWVQYEKYDGFYNAVKALCGRSMQKEGSILKANYHIGWDKEGYFIEMNISKRAYEKERRENMERRQLAGRTSQIEVATPQVQFAKIDKRRPSGEKHPSK